MVFLLRSTALVALVVPNSLGLKIVPVQHQVQKVDIGVETQLLQSTFRESYAYLHLERVKRMDGLPHQLSVVEYSKTVHRLRSTIDRWVLLEEKLRSSASKNSLANFKQVSRYIPHFPHLITVV